MRNDKQRVHCTACGASSEFIRVAAGVCDDCINEQEDPSIAETESRPAFRGISHHDHAHRLTTVTDTQQTIHLPHVHPVAVVDLHDAVLRDALDRYIEQFPSIDRDTAANDLVRHALVHTGHLPGDPEGRY